MTVLEVYEKYLIKVNRNDSNSNIHVPRGKFVLIYNEWAREWENEKLELKKSTKEVDELNDLLVADLELKKLKVTKDYVEYDLPENFLDFTSSYSIATKGRCEHRIDNWELKAYNNPVYLTDSNHSPSFEWEESLVQLGGKRVRIYTGDFKLKTSFISYYRFPKDIDIEGYIRLDGKPSTNIDPELDDLAVDQIISRAALETIRNSQNPDAFQFAKDRIAVEEVRK